MVAGLISKPYIGFSPVPALYHARYTVESKRCVLGRPSVALLYRVRCSGYSHIIAIGGNEPSSLLDAVTRYTIGGAGYVDPVAFENVFEVVDGVPTLTFEPMIRVRVQSMLFDVSRILTCCSTI